MAVYAIFMVKTMKTTKNENISNSVIEKERLSQSLTPYNWLIMRWLQHPCFNFIKSKLKSAKF